MDSLPPQQFLPLTPAPKSRYLSLAPATSASYPTKQVRTHARAETIPTEDAALTLRRSSTSSSSSSSNTGGYRVLKLGPVHWGEHPDEHKADFHDL